MLLPINIYKLLTYVLSEKVQCYVHTFICLLPMAAFDAVGATKTQIFMCGIYN